MKSQHVFPGSTPRIAWTAKRSISQSSLTLRILLITYFTFFAEIPGRHLRSSSAAALTPAPASGSSSAPMAMALATSGSWLFVLRSLKISVVAYGEEDQMMRTLGNVNVRRTILDWRAGPAGCVSEAPGFFLGGYLPVDLA